MVGQTLLDLATRVILTARQCPDITGNLRGLSADRPEPVPGNGALCIRHPSVPGSWQLIGPQAGATLGAEGNGGARAVGPAQAFCGCCGLKVVMAGTPAPNSHRKQSGGLESFPGLSRSIENPPSKRARSFSETTAPDPEDPFGEHAEFTADDLEELDILASQALSQCPVAPRNLSSECLGGLSPGGCCRPPQPGSSGTYWWLAPTLPSPF